MATLVNIPGNSNPIKVFSATGTGPGATTFVHDLGVEGNYPGELYPAVFIFAITDIVGSFSALQVNLEWSPITPDVGPAQYQTVGTWTPLTNPVTYFACSASGMYRLNCTTFTGGTSFNVYVSIASTMPQSTGGGGGGGSVTQGTVPWADNITQVAGVTLGATAVVAYGSTPAAVNVPGVNAFITNAGSIGGGVQFADNAASGATPTGTLSMGWDSANSKIRALKVDASQNLLVAVNAALPAGTNVIGHVIVDSGAITVSGSVSVSNFPATQNVAGTTTDGTTTETNFLVVGGESNDATAQYQPIPLGAGGRSVIIEGVASGTAVPISGSVSVSNFPATQAVSGTVTANQGTPNTLANKWPVQVTDGTNVMPTGDVIARALFHEITDGTNGPVAVKAASTGAAATDSALTVSLSPNSPVSILASGAAAKWTGLNLAGINPGHVVIVDSSGSGTVPAVKAASIAAIATDPAFVVALSPNSNSVSVSNFPASQIVQTIDEQKNLIQWTMIEELLTSLFLEMRAVRFGMQQLVSASSSKDDSSLIELAQESFTDDLGA